MMILQKAGKTNTLNFTKRATNIKFFASLPRVGLTYGINETNFPLYLVNGIEDISIQYPGKESVGTFPKPWDFRPILKKNSARMKNLSFADIWNYINAFIKNENNKEIQKRHLILFSRIFYKLAFLMCHDIQTINGATFYKFNKQLLNTEEQALLNMEIQVYDDNSNPFNITVESFIIYNDLLCTNEDCKYFYISYFDKLGVLKDNTKKPSDIIGFNLLNINTRLINWQSTVGRINTSLTHINVLKSMHDEDMFHLLALSIQLRGIFNIKNDENLITFLNQNIEA